MVVAYRVTCSYPVSPQKISSTLQATIPGNCVLSRCFPGYYIYMTEEFLNPAIGFSFRVAACISFSIRVDTSFRVAACVSFSMLLTLPCLV